MTGIHERVLFYYPGLAGQYRINDEVQVVGRNLVKHRDLNQYVYLFERWLQNQMNQLKQEPDNIRGALQVATAAHFGITGELHPFDDGNGRVARLVANFVLMQNTDERRFHKFFILPVPTLRERVDELEIRRRLESNESPKLQPYLRALYEVGEKWDLLPLEQALATSWVQSIDRFLGDFNLRHDKDGFNNPTDQKLIAVIRRRKARLVQIAESIAEGNYPEHKVPNFYTTKFQELAA